MYRFIFSTESYGGHYAPAFIDYFDQQNALIQTGKLSAEKITVSSLMINKCVDVSSKDADYPLIPFLFQWLV
jgi:carboxypeptidase C (cathepsin A)